VCQIVVAGTRKISGIDHASAHEIELQDDLSPSEWIRPRLLPWGVREGTPVTSVAPSGYPAYVRVLHPAQRRPREPVTWREIAAWSGRVYHPLMQFERICEPALRTQEPPPFDHVPEVGGVSPMLCMALYGALRSWTSTSETCWVGVWDGFGHLQGGSAATALTAAAATAVTAVRDGEVDEAERVKHEARAQAEAAMRERVRRAPRLSHPHRDYLLVRSSLDGVCRLQDWPWTVSPNLAWPDDRSWCVATEIDFDSTLVACSDECAAGLLADPRLETFQVPPEGRLDIEGDVLNPPLPRGPGPERPPGELR